MTTGSSRSPSDDNPDESSNLAVAKQATKAPPELSRADAVYLKVCLLFFCLLGVNLIIAWIFEFYLNRSVNIDISFVGNDPSWIPKGTTFPPALGVHYFGDFEQYAGYVKSPIPPYDPSIVYPAAYGPAAIVIVKILLAIAGWPASVFIFLAGSVALFLLGIWRLMGRYLTGKLLGLLLLFSGGIVIALDRGNVQILVAALFVWFCIGVLEDRPIVTVASLALAIGIKIYVGVLILALVKERRWRELGSVVLVSLAVYLICFALLGGGYFSDINSFLHTNLLFASSPSKGFVLGTVSAAAVVYKILWLAMGPHQWFHFLATSPTWYLQVPGLVVGLACIAIVWFTRYPRELILVALLALIQLGPAAAYPYLSINMVIELVLLVRVLSVESPTRSASVLEDSPRSSVSRPFLIACVVLLTIGAAPWLGMIYGANGAGTPLQEFIAPVTATAVVFTLLVGLLMGRRNRPQHSHALRSPGRIYHSTASFNPATALSSDSTASSSRVD